jgi:hypothetical protein
MGRRNGRVRRLWFATRFVPRNQQFHETWAVVDRRDGFLSVETGIGVGWSGGDKLTLKLMLSRDLNSQTH